MKSKKTYFTAFIALVLMFTLVALFALNIAGVYAATQQEVINWEQKDIWQNKTSIDIPEFSTNEIMIECGPRGGLAVLGFYDYVFPNLLNGDAYSGFYPVADDYEDFSAEYQELKTLMKMTSSGVTEKNFKNGLTDFVEKRGRSITFTSVMSRGDADLTECIFAFAAQKPVVMFVEGFKFVSNHDEQSYKDIYTYTVVENVRHIVVAYGHKLYTYDYVTKREFYLVNSGYRGNVMMPIDSFLEVNEAYVVEIT